MARYNVLAGRTEIAATQSRDLHGFWAQLLKKMCWPMPPKLMDQHIVAALSAENQPQILRALATETVSIITIARMLHDEDKETKRLLKAEKAMEAHDFEDDTLEGLTNV